MTGPDVAAAIRLLRDTVARHPDYGPAHSMLAFCQVLTGHFGWLPSYEVPRSAVESARRAVELDDNDPWAYLALGYVAIQQWFAQHLWGRLFGVQAVIWAVGPLIGPLLGSVFVELGFWRGIFWLIVTPGFWLGTGGTLGWVCHIIAAYTAYNYAKNHPY